MKLRFLDPAKEEMLRAAQLYDDQATGLGERFLDEVDGEARLLEDCRLVFMGHGNAVSA